MRAPSKRTLHRRLAARCDRGDSGGRHRVVHPSGGPLCPVAGSAGAAGPHLPAAALHRQPRGGHHPNPGPDRGGRRSLPAGSLPAGSPPFPAVSPGASFCSPSGTVRAASSPRGTLTPAISWATAPAMCCCNAAWGGGKPSHMTLTAFASGPFPSAGARRPPRRSMNPSGSWPSR